MISKLWIALIVAAIAIAAIITFIFMSKKNTPAPGKVVVEKWPAADSAAGKYYVSWPGNAARTGSWLKYHGCFNTATFPYNQHVSFAKCYDLALYNKSPYMGFADYNDETGRGNCRFAGPGFNPGINNRALYLEEKCTRSERMPKIQINRSGEISPSYGINGGLAIYELNREPTL